MIRKPNITCTTVTILLVAFLISAGSGGWNAPLAQMDMPTSTAMPQTTAIPPTSIPPDSPAPGPTMTSIFTGYTPYPNSTYTNNMGAMGGCMGMSGTSGMGMGSMGAYNGTYTNTQGMSGMGSMGTGTMNMSGCAMMGSMNMSGVGMNDDLSMLGMEMSESYTPGADDSLLNQPWQILGWILVGLVSLAILTGAGLGIAWLIRRGRVPGVE